MPQIKNTFLKSKMNKDLDARIIPNGEYRNAENISISKSEGADVGALENIKGNEIFNDPLSYIQSYEITHQEVIGSFVDTSKDRAFLFFTSFEDSSTDNLSYFFGENYYTPQNSFIVMIDFTKEVLSERGVILVEGNFLNFSKTHPICGVNVIEDLLFWTDNRNQPRKININKALEGKNTYSREDQISLAKYYPWNPIRLYEEKANAIETVPSMKNKTDRWLDYTNSPVIMFPQQTSQIVAGNHVKYKDYASTSGHYFFCYTYAEPNNFSGSGWDIAGQDTNVKDTLQRQWLPADTTYNPNGDYRIQPGKNPANNQLVAFYGSRTQDNKSIGKNNDCRLISAKVVEGDINNGTISGSSVITGVTLWRFQIWAESNGGSINNDLQSLHNSLDRQLSTALGFRTGNEPVVEKCKLFFHYPNPDYDSSYSGTKEFLKDKFVRLSYRYKFIDDEYSLIAPFTQHIFTPKQHNHIMGEDVNKIKKSLDLPIMENNVDSVTLYIDNPINDFTGLAFNNNQLMGSLNIKEIEILYKSSKDSSIKSIDTLKIENLDLSSKFIEYEYKCTEPTKTLPESEMTRVYDQVPVRAKTQEAIGNRIIFGNFIDKNDYPKSIKYTANFARKRIDNVEDVTSTKNRYPSFAAQQYPTHNVKNNRTYQIGFILCDRYGRQSDVIVAPDDIQDIANGDKASTVYVPYKPRTSEAWADQWFAGNHFGDSLRIHMLDKIQSEKLYSIDNPLGWYSYKVVVKQQEQEYYNLYVPGIQSATTYAKGYNYTTDSDGEVSTPKTLDLVDFYFQTNNPRYQIEISGDNINKLPRSLNNVGPNDRNFAGSDTGLYTRVSSNNWNLSMQYFLEIDREVTPDKVETIREFNTFNIEPSDLIEVEETSATDTFFVLDPIPKWDFYNGGNFLTKSSTLLIGTVSSYYSTDPGAAWDKTSSTEYNPVEDDDGIKGSAIPNNARWVRFGVLETTPVKSDLDIFWETTTTGVISDLNNDLETSLEIYNGQTPYVELELKYFNSFTVRNIIKHSLTWKQYEPFPGYIQRDRVDDEGELGKTTTFKYPNLFSFPMNITSNIAREYRSYSSGANLWADRLPAFWSMFYYNWNNYDSNGKIKADLWHDFPIYDSLFMFPDYNPGYIKPGGEAAQYWTQCLPYDSWYIEEARIRGGYNNTPTDYGVRAYLQNDDQNKSTHRFSSLIYSGVYNSRTGINETNVFSIGEDITKTAEPAYGSIQKLHAEDTNLTIFQENKISRALIDKDAIYAAEGGGTVTSSNLVIGQIQPYVGQYGISTNPESFAFFGRRRYCSDKNRNAILRISNDGITEISQYGMSDFFRDELRNIETEGYNIKVRALAQGYSQTNTLIISNNVNATQDVRSLIKAGMKVTNISNPDPLGNLFNGFIENIDTNNPYQTVVQVSSNNSSFYQGGTFEFEGWAKDSVRGAWDENNDMYTISLIKDVRVKEYQFAYVTKSSDITPKSSKTITFDETILGWTTFLSFIPDEMFSFKGNFFTTKSDTIYKHYSDISNRGEFYGEQGDMNITFIFNSQPSITKNFKTISYEGSNGWEAVEMFSDAEGADSGVEYIDTIKPIKSYDEGVYHEDGIKKRVGFNRKENRYVANIRSNNTTRPGQVIIDPNGENVSGVKGYFTTVKIQVDNTTDVGKFKELFSVATDFVVSSY